MFGTIPGAQKQQNARQQFAAESCLINTKECIPIERWVDAEIEKEENGAVKTESAWSRATGWARARIDPNITSQRQVKHNGEGEDPWDSSLQEDISLYEEPREQKQKYFSGQIWFKQQDHSILLISHNLFLFNVRDRPLQNIVHPPSQNHSHHEPVPPQRNWTHQQVPLLLPRMSDYS